MNCILRLLLSRLMCALILLVLVSVCVLSQTMGGGSASLRGTATIGDKLVAEGVMVVVVPARSDGSLGSPRPAYVGKNGEYRIAELNPGPYILKASGPPIKPKDVPITIAQGNSNVQNLTFERADKPVKVSGSVRGPQGQLLRNATVAIYSAAIPPSVCEQCALAKFVSNDKGEAQDLELAGGQDYNLVVSMYDEANKRELKMIAPEIISIGNEAQARLQLQLGEGSQPVVTAKLLRDIQPAPQQMDLRRSELASGGDTTNPAGSRTLLQGQKLKLKGVVVRRDADTFTVRDMNGVDTVVRLEDRTSVKTHGGFLRGGDNYGQTSILRGLNLQVEGYGNASGELNAAKIRFNESDMRVARAVESRAAPLEERASDTENKLSQVEANAQRLSGQLEELAALSNAARGGAKAAQATADAAVAGVNATNERISALDDYTPQTTAAVNFKPGSAVLSPESKITLDDIASKALNAKGYVLEVSGYADSRGSINLNRQLSQRRADAVIRYLVENHNIPLRRIVTPYGYGEINPVAENNSREGRAQNRRVEIKLLVNKGLTAPSPTMNPKL